MTEKYIYLSDNYGRRSGTERRRMPGFLIEEERRLGDRRTYKDRRITMVKRRSRSHTSHESDRRSGQERRGIPSILMSVDEI